MKRVGDGLVISARWEARGRNGLDAFWSFVGMEVCGGLRKCPGALRGVGEGEYCTTSQTRLESRSLGPRQPLYHLLPGKPDPRTHL